ncbi:MAG: 2'-5' RNA ligase family protein [Candidatus Pacearchaeota archaeon]
MDKYHIGTRLAGYPRNYIKDLALFLDEKSGKRFSERIVPHLTFIPPFIIDNEEEVINIFNSTLSKFNKDLTTYKINGFGFFTKPEPVFYANIEKNEKINKMIKSLENNLENKITYLSEKISDIGETNKYLHVTVSKDFNPEEFNNIISSIDEYTNKYKFREMEHPLFRIYLLKNKYILREHSFALEESLYQPKAKRPFIFEEDKEIFSRKSGLKLSSDGMVN